MPGLREKKKASTKESLLNAAEKLFRERGYGETTVDQIADLAQISKVTFYGYFKAKEDLLTGLHNRVLESALERINQPEHKNAGAISTLKLLATDLGRWTEENSELFKVLLSEKTVPLNACSQADSESDCPAAQAMIDILERGIVSGELRNDIDANRIGRYLALMSFSEKITWLQLGCKDSLVERLQTCVDILVSGIKAKKV